MRLRSISTLSTVTLTLWLTLTTSAGSLTKRSASLADVDQPVLVNADVDEGPEGGHVGDDPGQLHARLEVLHLVDPFGERERLELLARVAARLGQLLPGCR